MRKEKYRLMFLKSLANIPSTYMLHIISSLLLLPIVDTSKDNLRAFKILGQ